MTGITWLANISTNVDKEEIEKGQGNFKISELNVVR